MELRQKATHQCLIARKKMPVCTSGHSCKSLADVLETPERYCGCSALFSMFNGRRCGCCCGFPSVLSCRGCTCGIGRVGRTSGALSSRLSLRRKPSTRPLSPPRGSTTWGLGVGTAFTPPPSSPRHRSFRLRLPSLRRSRGRCAASTRPPRRSGHRMTPGASPSVYPRLRLW